MNAVELEKELWEINNELVKAGIKPREYPTMHEAVNELVKRYKDIQPTGIEITQPEANRIRQWFDGLRDTNPAVFEPGDFGLYEKIKEAERNGAYNANGR